MRRFWVFFVLLISIFFVEHKDLCLSDLVYNEGAIFTFYSSNCVGDMKGCARSLGVGYMITTDKKNYKEIYSLIKNDLYGQSVSFAGGESCLKEFINKNNIEIKVMENFTDIVNIYGKGNFGKCIEIYGEDINIQLSFRGGIITIGFPIIMGSY